jgi:hypothetical protein
MNGRRDSTEVARQWVATDRFLGVENATRGVTKWRYFGLLTGSTPDRAVGYEFSRAMLQPGGPTCALG